MVFMYHYHHIMVIMLSMRDLSHCIGQPGMMRGMSGYPGALFLVFHRFLTPSAAEFTNDTLP